MLSTERTRDIIEFPASVAFVTHPVIFYLKWSEMVFARPWSVSYSFKRGCLFHCNMALKEERLSSCFEIFLLCYIFILSCSSYTTRVLLALKYYILISREEQLYALGVFHDITFWGD